jgi:hypothetical protein
MMKHFRRGITVVRRRHPTLVMRGDDSVPSTAVGTTQESPQSTAVSQKMPTSTMIAVIVLTIVGFLAIICKCFFIVFEFECNYL